MVCVVYLEIDQGTWRLQCWPDTGQTLSGIDGSIAESPGNACDLFSRSNCSSYPKGHRSSALSRERTELIIHAQRYNNRTTKGS